MKDITKDFIHSTGKFKQNKAMYDWISMEEDTPNYGQTVWLTNGKEIFIGERMENTYGDSYGYVNKPMQFDGKRWWGGIAVEDIDFDPTHWMPLPDLPISQ